MIVDGFLNFDSSTFTLHLDLIKCFVIELNS